MTNKTIIDNIDFSGLKNIGPTYNWARLWQGVGISFGVSALTLVSLLLFVDPDGNLLTRFNGSLLITMFIFVPSIYYSVKSSLVDTEIIRFIIQNSHRLVASQFPLGAFHPKSVAGLVMRTSDKSFQVKEYDEMSIYSSMIANGVRRNDSLLPEFYVGRVASSGNAYDEYLQIIIDLPRTCPHVLIDYDSSYLQGRKKYLLQLKADQRFELEGKFADAFTLYAPTPDNARFATYVLTPNVMEQVMQLAPTADIEIIDQQLIILWKQRTTGKSWSTVLPELFSTLNTIGATLYERATAYSTHTEEPPASKLLFNTPVHIYNNAILALRSLPNGYGDAFNMMRNKGFWMTVIIVPVFWVSILSVEAIIYIFYL